MEDTALQLGQSRQTLSLQEPTGSQVTTYMEIGFPRGGEEWYVSHLGISSEIRV